MKAISLVAALGLALSLVACSASQITQIQAATVAVNNFNNALITLATTMIGNVTALQARLAPLECGAISLGNSLAAQPAIAKAVNAALTSASKQAATAAGEFQVTATALCQAAGLSATVTAIPVTASGAP